MTEEPSLLVNTLNDVQTILGKLIYLKMLVVLCFLPAALPLGLRMIGVVLVVVLLVVVLVVVVVVL